MNNNDTSGWTFPRVLGLIVGLVGMVGFGVCSVCGILIGVNDPQLWSTVLLFALPGFALTWLCFELFRRVRRRARSHLIDESQP